MIKPLIEGNFDEIEEYIETHLPRPYAPRLFFFTLKTDHPEQLITHAATKATRIIWDSPQLVCFHDEEHAIQQESEFHPIENGGVIE